MKYRIMERLMRGENASILLAMSTITEIEAAIRKLPQAQVAKLAAWIEDYRTGSEAPASVELWLKKARGAAMANVTTDGIMALTRGEE